MMCTHHDVQTHHDVESKLCMRIMVLNSNYASASWCWIQTIQAHDDVESNYASISWCWIQLCKHNIVLNSTMQAHYDVEFKPCKHIMMLNPNHASTSWCWIQLCKHMNLLNSTMQAHHGVEFKLRKHIILLISTMQSHQGVEFNYASTPWCWIQLCKHIMVLNSNYACVSWCWIRTMDVYHGVESKLCKHIMVLNSNYASTSWCWIQFMHGHHGVESQLCIRTSKIFKYSSKPNLILILSLKKGYLQYNTSETMYFNFGKAVTMLDLTNRDIDIYDMGLWSIKKDLNFEINVFSMILSGSNENFDTIVAVTGPSITSKGEINAFQLKLIKKIFLKNIYYEIYTRKCYLKTSGWSFYKDYSWICEVPTHLSQALHKNFLNSVLGSIRVWYNLFKESFLVRTKLMHFQSFSQ